jgi:putative transposase
VIDVRFMETPRGHGSRQMARHLRRQGYTVGRKRIRRLMGRMGLSAVSQQPRVTGQVTEGLRRHPDLRGVALA